VKILHVYRTYYPDSQGGLEEVIRQICLNTREEGVESRVFTLSDNPHPAVIDAAEGRIVRAQLSFEIASCGFCLGGLRDFARQVDWADLVHYHFPWPFADMMYMLAGRRRPSVVTYHSDIVRQRMLYWFYGPVMHHFLRSMDRIVATSPNYLATSDVLVSPDLAVDIVPIGLNRDSYPPAVSIDAASVRMRERYGQDFFLFVGVLRYYKGLHILLQAALDADFRVIIVGTGPEEGALRQQARALGLDNVEFTGYLPDQEKMALLSLCRGVVLPSHLRSEAFGVTLLEGAMMSKPLISAEVGSGSSHINIHEATGLVVTPGCPRSLRAAMQRLHADASLARQYGQAAFERFQQRFTGQLMGKRYAEIYRSTLSGRTAGSRSLESPA